jgi:hypothetical protein
MTFRPILYFVIPSRARNDNFTRHGSFKPKLFHYFTKLKRPDHKLR